MQQPHTQPIGVIGLGAMGSGVARALLDAGLTVIGCDIDATARDSFDADGGASVTAPSELARRCQVVLLLVVDAGQIEAVLFGENGLVDTLGPGDLIVQCATASPDYVKGLDERLATRGLLMLDAPVSGGAARARTGELSVMASGSDAAFTLAGNALDAMAAHVYRLGDRPGIGSSMKLVNQQLAGVHIAAAAEAMAMGISLGLDPTTVYEVITHSAGNSWMFENRVPHILRGDYTPLSAVDIFVKDLGIVKRTAHDLRLSLPVAASALQQFTAASGAGLGREDDSAVIKVYQRLSGFELPAANDDAQPEEES